MTIISRIDYRVYKKFDKLAYGISILLLLAVLIPGLGKSAGGATRWIVIKPLGSLSIQPSEIAKIGLVIFFASYLTDNRDKLEDKKIGFFKPIIQYLLPVIGVLLVFQSHLSASLLIILVISIMMIMAGSRIRNFVTYGSIAAGFRSSVLCILWLQFLIKVYIELQDLHHF